VAELHLTEATVELCYCLGHMCNAASARHPAVLGGMGVAGSLAALALATGTRLISG